VSVCFAKEGLTFTGAKDGQPVSPMDKLMLQLIGAVAEFERSMIRERQREGIQAAKKAGKRIGAPPKLSAAQKDEIRAMKAKGQGVSELARHFGVSRNTAYGVLRE
jgi:DNA invertase Pin-like site-specific DNA recombinase